MESIGLEMEDIFGAEEENNNVDIGAEQNPFESTENPDEENTYDANTTAKLAKGAAKKVVRNPQPKLDPQRLAGQRGIAILPKLFENVKFKGKGYEAQDLEKVIKGLEHWAHRLFPKRTFEECLQTIEKLGNKREVKTCIKKIRLDMPLLDEDFVSKPEVDRNPELDEINEAENAFDEMMQASMSSQLMSPSNSQVSVSLPPPTQPNSSSKPKTVLSDELKEKIERNRRLALERRTQKLLDQTLQNQDIPLSIPSSQDEEEQSKVAETHSNATTKQHPALPSTNEHSCINAEVITSGNNESIHSDDDVQRTSFSMDTSEAIGDDASPIPASKDPVPPVSSEQFSDDKMAETPVCDNSIGIGAVDENTTPISASKDPVPPVSSEQSSDDKMAETPACNNSVDSDTSGALGDNASPIPASKDPVPPVSNEQSSDDKMAETPACNNSVDSDTSGALGDNASPIPANKDPVPPVSNEQSSDDKMAETPVCDNSVGIDTSKISSQ